MFSTQQVTTWVNGARRNVIDRAASRQIRNNLLNFEKRRGRSTLIDSGQIRGWIFSGYPAAAQAFLDAHPIVAQVRPLLSGRTLVGAT